MAFALWIDDSAAWAQGTHEYRPMGVAVIAASDQFRSRDFSPHRRSPKRSADTFHGLFASLGDVNRYLSSRRAAPRRRPSGQSRLLPLL